ncbi:flagellar basal body rod protein FlgB [Paraburkholderia sp. SIMBA_009]
MLDKLDAAFAFDKQVLDVRSYRQELMSSNIANADTPGYKARDVDFASSLARALRRSDGTVGSGPSKGSALPMMGTANITSGVTMALTQPGHIAGDTTLVAMGGPADDYGPLLYRIPIQPALDGNTVDLDTERVQFADNTVHFESLLTDVSGEIKTLQSAITSGGT